MVWKYKAWAASHTLQLAVHEGLLSQCSITDSPANTRKVEANVGIAYAEEESAI